MQPGNKPTEPAPKLEGNTSLRAVRKWVKSRGTIRSFIRPFKDLAEEQRD